MSDPRPEDPPRPGLRERKKARTRAAIQRHALRLFRTQGYDATTVEQIADAAEVSPSTFFRYFPSKEDAVLYDDLDPLAYKVFQAQPPELPPMTALRNTLHAVFDELASEERTVQEDRVYIFRTVPQVRARALEQFVSELQTITELFAERTGRSPDDFSARVTAGAVIGVGLAIIFQAIEDPEVDFVELFDQGLAQLEGGLAL